MTTPRTPILVTALLLTATAFLRSAQPAGPPTALVAAREALGGAAALDRVTTLSASGSQRRIFDVRSLTGTLEVLCLLPDRFIRIGRRPTGTGGQGHVTDYWGFNGIDPIGAVFAPDLQRPQILVRGPERSPEEIAESRSRMTQVNKHRFFEFALQLLATSFATYPLEFSDGGEFALAVGRADAIDVKGPDGSAWRLFLDPATHLPMQLTWMGGPLVVVSSSTQP